MHSLGSWYRRSNMLLPRFFSSRLSPTPLTVLRFLVCLRLSLSLPLSLRLILFLVIPPLLPSQSVPPWIPSSQKHPQAHRHPRGTPAKSREARTANRPTFRSNPSTRTPKNDAACAAGMTKGSNPLIPGWLLWRQRLCQALGVHVLEQ